MQGRRKKMWTRIYKKLQHALVNVFFKGHALASYDNKIYSLP